MAQFLCFHAFRFLVGSVAESRQSRTSSKFNGQEYEHWWLRTSSKFNGQEYEEFHWNISSLETTKALSRCGFLQPQSSHCNKKSADWPIFSV